MNQSKLAELGLGKTLLACNVHASKSVSASTPEIRDMHHELLKQCSFVAGRQVVSHGGKAEFKEGILTSIDLGYTLCDTEGSPL